MTLLSDEEQKAVDQGEAATSLLEHPAFLQTMGLLRHQCAEAILTSDPQAKDAREDAYQLSRGLSAITAELLALQARAETILVNATAPDDLEPQDAPVGDY